VLRLPRLAATDMAGLVRPVATGRAAVAPLLHRKTEGVPFFVVEDPAALRADGRREEAMAHLKQAAAIFAEVGEPGALEPEIWKLVAW
jgi:hypothetical protein